MIATITFARGSLDCHCVSDCNCSLPNYLDCSHSLGTPREELIGCSEFTILNLSYNNISRVEFINDISGNRNTFLPEVRATYITAFQFSSLDVLFLSGNPLENLCITAPTIRRLEARDCGLKFISGGDLAEVSNLRLLDLSKNDISFIEQNAFLSLHKLEHLTLSINYLTVLPDDVFLYSPNLVSLDLSNNRLTRIPDSITSSWKTLSYLYLQNNAIEKIQPALFGSLPKLNLLDLSGNSPTYDSRINHISTNLKLKYLFISFKQFYSSFVPQSLHTLSLVGNHMTSFNGERFQSQEKLEVMKVSNLTLVSVNSTMFKYLYQLIVLELQGNNIETLTYSPFSNLKHLQVLKLSSNQIKRISGLSFAELHALSVLDLTSNSIDNINEQSFFCLTSLKELYLGNNKLTVLPLNVFKPLKLLQVLVLEHNSLAVIDIQVLCPLQNMQLLDISDNLMTDILYNTTENCETQTNDLLQQLQSLDAGGNLFTSIPENVAEILSRASRIDLSFNPLQNLSSSLLNVNLNLTGVSVPCDCSGEPPTWAPKTSGVECRNPPICTASFWLLWIGFAVVIAINAVLLGFIFR